MKVALINHWPFHSGVGCYVFSLFKYMIRSKKVDVTMICVGPVDLEGASEEMRDRIVLLSKAQLDPILFRAFKYFVAPRMLPKSFDLYHISDHMIGRFARSAHPSIITIHDVAECKVYRSEDLILPSSSRIGELLTPLLMPPSLYNFFLTKSMSDSRLADGVICVSEFSKYQAIRYLGIDPKKIIVIFSGVDHEVFKPRDKAFCREHFGFPLNIPIVLHVGSEIQRKNIPVLLKSFRRFKENFPDAILVRVGRKRSSTAHIIEKYGLTHSIRYFYGIQTDLARLYNAADLFVFPSSYEGFGLPPLEAMASGCPVIAGNCDAIREVVNSAGILVDPHDEKGLFLAMKELFEDEGLRQELIRKGIDRSKKFSWEMCAKETIRYYEKVLNEKKIYGYS